MRLWAMGAAALAMTLAAGGPALAAPKAKAPQKDAKVWAAAEAARPGQLELLKTIVNIDSGTGDVEGGRKVAAVLTPRLRALGMDIQMVPAEAEGLPDNLVATLKGTGRTRILIISHMDTVFGPGTVARWPFRIEGDRAFGPGVSDEKGGVVEAVTALELLSGLGFRDYRQIVLLVETSEERGSPGTQKLIGRLLQEADVELNMEPGDAPDVVTVWRKGSTVITIDVKGRAAHAGVSPQDGRNAAYELIHQLAGLEQYPKTGDGLTLNLTLLSGGSRNNIIPEDASATFSLRVRDQADVAKVIATMEANGAKPLIPDTTIRVSQAISYPPLQNNPATDALADRAGAIYAGLGRTLGRGGNGGASESALAAAAGVPALDGLGPVGGGYHSEKEFMDLTTVTPRLYLLMKLIMDLGKTPPPKP